jgi:phenylacetate-CoA ligase
MFVRPEQVAELRRKLDVTRVRVVADRDGDADTMAVLIESDGGDAAQFEPAVQEVLKLRASVEVMPLGSLPNDGLVIEDKRSYD